MNQFQISAEWHTLVFALESFDDSAKVENWSGDSYSLEANRYFQDDP